MNTTTFLINDDLWETLSKTIKSARKIEAAIAYLGTNGAKLLPLRRGHRLVVDMSLASVKAGNTNPYEVEKLIRRGVKAFTRRDLHAKVIIADNMVLVGSANVSMNSKNTLDEAAVLTKDLSVARRAHEFIERICSEPVRPEYLAECKKAYKPPRKLAGRTKPSGSKNARATHAKLWLVNLVDDYSIPESEIGRFEEGEKKAQSLLRNSEKCELTSFHWPHKPKMADELEMGDWVIQCIKHKDGSITVWPSAQLLFIDKYIRNLATGKERYVFHLEILKRCQSMNWAEFRKSAKSVVSDSLNAPRTKPIRNTDEADGLLRLWTSAGRISRR